MVLTFVDAYIVQIFFKTIFLVIGFSLIHGIVFLPVLLTIMLPNAHIRKQKHFPRNEKAEEMQFAARKLTPKLSVIRPVDAMSVDSKNLQDIDLASHKGDSETPQK